jgi:c-di-GMP-binding flagellar brake protein YcgR
LEEPRIERRREFRLSTVGGGYKVRYTFRGRPVTEARLVNLSAGGCGLEIQMADARNLEIGTVLEEIVLVHADLPCVPLEGVVVRVLGKVPGKTAGYVLAGVEFSLITPFIRQLIRDHTESRSQS